MAGRRGTSLVLMLTCLAASTAGVDNDVQKVDLPEVVKDPLGPRMEVLSQSGPREMRAATFPGFPSGCLSCTTGGLGGSTYGSSYSLDAGFPRPGLLRPVSESQGNSYKHEVRSESKIVNGQPVYDLYHERRFEDGNLVHEERKEKGAKDVDASLSLGQAQGYPDGPGYSRHLHETHLQSSSVGSSDYGSAGTLSAHGGVSPDYNSDLSSLSERLRQQMLLLKNRKGHENLGGSHHAVYSQTRYVNGQPVYVKKEERKYEDGQLVYNRTDEKGPDDLGTQHVAQQYDTSGSPVGPGGGYYERREEQRHFSSSSQGSHALHPGTFPGRAPAREESLYHRQDSAYPSYRPGYNSGSTGSSTQYTQDSREETSSGYRPYRPTSGSSTQYTQDTREESSPRHTPDRATSSSSSTQYTLESQSSHRPQTDRWTHTQQTDEELHSSYRPASRPSTSSTHSRQDTSTSTQYTQESTEGPTYPSRPSYRPSGSTSHEREESYESSWQQQRRNHTYTPSSGDFHTTVVQQNTRQPETTTQGALDSSRRDGSSDIYSQTYEQSSSTDSTNHDQYSRGYNTEYDQRQQGVTSHYSQEASAERRLTTDEGRDTVGIPGVLSGPHSQYGNDEKHNKERYDISPLEDNGPELPSVDNEIDSSYVPTLAPVDSEIDSSVYSGRGQESAIHTDRRYHSSRQDTSRTDTHSQGRPTHGYSDSSYHYRHNRTTTQGAINSVPVSTPAQVPGADDASSYGYPSVEGTSRHHYNESWRTSISADSQPQPAYGSTSSSSSSSQVRNCGQFSCIVVGDGQLSSSRQTQTRVSTRYVNGELVGITHHIRQYEDGKLVHENRTEQSVDDLSEEDLRRYGIDQLHLVQGSYQPESYSQRHEVRQEKKYVNGEQTYDLHHERRFEDGSLVYENRTEKDADELGASSPGGYEGSYSQTHQEGGARHEVTQSQHLQQHVTSGAVGDITAGHAAETQQVTDTAHVAVVPVYTSRRYETRRQQEFVDGQPTYDLHHERHFNNGSLVYENKTELNEGELRTSHSSGHQDALHQILSGNTLSTAYDRSSSATAHGSYGSGLEASRSSYGESAASQSAGSYSGSSASYHGSESSRQTGLYGESASSQIGGSYSGSSSQGSGSYGGTGVSYSSSSSSETHESSASGFPVGHTAGSSRATTSVLGAGSYSSSSQQESSGGCLSCMLVGSSGFSGQGSLGVSGGAGADGYSHRQEMNMEEHYEDGQLVHGQEESRVFENGQLVHESQRQYADAPSQSFRASALQSSEASSGEAASCEKSYCQNGGTCIPGFMGPLCTCPFGFKGKDCSEPYCPKRFCRYGGSCRVDGARHVCACAEGYSGYRCQTRTYRHARRHASKP
nr:filaggrin-2-like isoform X31 [Penaeus vannamei]